jgi:preprotein translocase subunit SecD
VFFLGLLLAYGLVAVGGVWKPKLGLDLQGGTRITLIAQGDVSADRLAEARGIIEDRVNGSGVAEAEVSTQGNKYVVVEIPGESRRDLVETVKRQAQMRFRLVAAAAPGTAGAGADQGGSPTVPGTPGAGGGSPRPRAPPRSPSAARRTPGPRRARAGPRRPRPARPRPSRRRVVTPRAASTTR